MLAGPMMIYGLVLSGRSSVVASAIGLYIAGAYFFTSSTSFANPAVTAARTITDTYAGIAPASAPWFILAQLCGTALAVGLVAFTFPRAYGIAT